MGRDSQDFQGRGMGRQGPDMPPLPDVRPFPPGSPEGEDVFIPAPPMQRRGMGGRGMGMQQPPVMEPFGPDAPEEDVLVPAPPEDVVRPLPPMQRRGMGRRGWNLPESEAVEPGPRGPGRRID